MTNLESFCEKNRLDFDKVKKEIESIKKAEGISDIAAFNKWKTKNLSELAVRKRGKELRCLYLGNEYVGITDYNDNPFFRIYFLVFPTAQEMAEGHKPDIAYLKLDESIIDDKLIFKEDPVPFEAWKIPFGYISTGDRSKWIVASRDDNGIPEMVKDDEFKPINEQVHEALKEASKHVEDFYLDSLIEDKVSFNPIFYLQVTSVEVGKNDIIRYNFVDLTDEDSFVRVTLTDWEGEIEPLENYEHVLVIGGYTKQRVQYKNTLELRYSAKVPIIIVGCPTIY